MKTIVTIGMICPGNFLLVQIGSVSVGKLDKSRSVTNATICYSKELTENSNIQYRRLSSSRLGRGSLRCKKACWLKSSNRWELRTNHDQDRNS